MVFMTVLRANGTQPLPINFWGENSPFQKSVLFNTQYHPKNKTLISLAKALMLKHWQALLGRKIMQSRLEELVRIKKHEKTVTMPCTVYNLKTFSTSLKDYQQATLFK